MENREEAIQVTINEKPERRRGYLKNLVGIATAFVIGGAFAWIVKPKETERIEETVTKTITKTTATTPLISAFKLELLSSRLYRESDFIIAEGEVKNIHDQKLDNVVVVITFTTETREFVKSEDALIEYNPILPGQTSLWKVIATDNPEIKRCTIEFKEFSGGTIPMKDSRK